MELFRYFLFIQHSSFSTDVTFCSVPTHVHLVLSLRAPHGRVYSSSTVCLSSEQHQCLDAELTHGTHPTSISYSCSFKQQHTYSHTYTTKNCPALPIPRRKHLLSSEQPTGWWYSLHVWDSKSPLCNSWISNTSMHSTSCKTSSSIALPHVKLIQSKKGYRDLPCF